MSVTLNRISPKHWFFAVLAALVVIAAVDVNVLTGAPARDLPRYSFSVELDGIAAGRFREVSGLAIETEVIEYRDGSGGPVRVVPAHTKFSSIKLTRAFTGDMSLYNWYTTYARTGTLPLVGGLIIIYDQSHTEVARYSFTQGWPKKYEGPTLKADGNEVAVETLEIAHAGFTVERP